MPFAEIIGRLREALTPKGVLAIIGCYREATLADYTREIAAIPANITANAITKAKARRHALRLLPGAVIRRRLYWRYSLIYHHPTSKTG